MNLPFSYMASNIDGWSPILGKDSETGDKSTSYHNTTTAAAATTATTATVQSNQLCGKLF